MVERERRQNGRAKVIVLMMDTVVGGGVLVVVLVSVLLVVQLRCFPPFIGNVGGLTYHELAATGATTGGVQPLSIFYGAMVGC